MNLNEVRDKFIKFYQKNGHVNIHSASLMPENDPTTLFTGSGMQPLVPYLLGQKHPMGKRLVNSQKSFRSGDISDIGDNRHTTFFEMLGNWSLGDYFKDEQIPWIFQFLTEEIGLDPKKLYVTVFIGDEKNAIPKDQEAADIWKKLFAEKGIDAKDVELGSEEEAGKVGMQDGRIFYYDAKKNWWSRSGVPENMPEGEPGGPDSEIFFEFDSVVHDKKFGQYCHPNCDCGHFMEIGNSVFMEYIKTAGGFAKLPQKNVDFGGGLERIAVASLDNPDVFKSDLFNMIIDDLSKYSGKSYIDTAYTAGFRVVADHVRSATFLIADGILPSNTDRGYFVRRLLRRAIYYRLFILNINAKNAGGFEKIIKIISNYYKEIYPNLNENLSDIIKVINEEEAKFTLTIKKGSDELKKILKTDITGEQIFDLYQSYGLPLELTEEIAFSLSGKKVGDEQKQKFAELLKNHQDLSRGGSEKRFKGGLADSSDMSVRYHTATHLLNAALRQVLGKHVGQKGSNITAERMRFDFSHEQKMTDAEKQAVEKWVNDAIERALPVTFQELPKEQAEKLGAIHAFGEKYGDMVKVYTVGAELDTSTESGPGKSETSSGIISREFCGGPHVQNTKELAGPEGKWRFKIIKEEAVSAGVRRIKAVLA